MAEILTNLISLILIATVSTGIVYARKLLKQLQELRASRTEMERFVLEFSSSVQRAEAGVKGLRLAARESGDDLEKLLEKGQLLRDELHFLIESADQMASRISNQAATVARQILPDPSSPPMAPPPSTPAPAAPAVKPATETRAQPVSKAEQELMRALGKLGGSTS